MADIVTIIEKTQERFRSWLRRCIVILLLLPIFFVVGGGVSHHEGWQVTRLEVSGARVVPREDIVRIAEAGLAGNTYAVYARNNSYLFPRRGIERSLLYRFPRLTSARIDRVNAHTLAISVTERKPFALWCGDVFVKSTAGASVCWYLDRTGFIFDRAPIFSEGTYLELYGAVDPFYAVDPVRQRVASKEFESILIFAEALRGARIEPSRASISPDHEISIHVYASTSYPALVGAELRFNNDQDIRMLAKHLIAALPVQFPANTPHKRKLYYIDLRFDNKVFFGFENMSVQKYLNP
jgi:hypothetical protein